MQAGASCVPDVTAFELTPRDQFMLLACDGFWSVSAAVASLHGVFMLCAELTAV
jgi:serine/threonine protein phosphatase PrpC